VTALAAARAGRGDVLAAGYADGSLRLWSLLSQACLLHLPPPGADGAPRAPRRLRFAPNGGGGGWLVVQARGPIGTVTLPYPTHIALRARLAASPLFWAWPACCGGGGRPAAPLCRLGKHTARRRHGSALACGGEAVTCSDALQADAPDGHSELVTYFLGGTAGTPTLQQARHCCNSSRAEVHHGLMRNLLRASLLWTLDVRAHPHKVYSRP
jgi:hypothetical protein